MGSKVLCDDSLLLHGIETSAVFYGGSRTLPVNSFRVCLSHALAMHVNVKQKG